MLSFMIETLSVTIAAATLTVSIVGFGILRIMEIRRDRRQARRIAVTRVLDSVERATRVLATSSVSGIWTNHVFEFSQLLARLMVDLERRDQVIAVWVYRETQQLVRAGRRKDAARILQNVGFVLATWHAGGLKRSWFKEQVAANPPQEPFVMPRSFRMRANFTPLLTLLTLPVLFGFLTGVGFRGTLFMESSRQTRG